jgi:putative tryptophan/tyrosine transport system permease protein
MFQKLQAFLEPGIVYGIGTLGLALIFRYLRFPDFTVLGSIVVGGISTIFFTNLWGPEFGLMLGAASGALLGLLTGFLTSVLKIRPVLAGIISFTASFSLGFIMADGGTIDIALALRTDLPLQPMFSGRDFFRLSFLAILIAATIAFFLITKSGALLIAMTAGKDFTDYRHRYWKRTFMLTALAGNAIVALAGGLHSLNDRVANVQSHIDFLPFSLGAIFAGNAVTIWAGKLLHSYRVDDALEGNEAKSRGGRITKGLRRIFSAEGEDPLHVLTLLLSYSIGCFFLLLLSRAVQSNAFAVIDSDWQYLVTAALMTLFVFWSGSDDEGQ